MTFSPPLSGTRCNETGRVLFKTSQGGSRGLKSKSSSSSAEHGIWLQVRSWLYCVISPWHLAPLWLRLGPRCSSHSIFFIKDGYGHQRQTTARSERWVWNERHSFSFYDAAYRAWLIDIRRGNSQLIKLNVLYCMSVVSDSCAYRLYLKCTF